MWVQTPKCVVCGERGQLEVEEGGLARFWAGALVQEAFPQLDADQRELMISGTHAHCFEAISGGEDDE